mmetsp:Transcript_2542/g.3394  ORF Transcript_2542/g.3394 Transcript_2542/m.3394 type:complete len:196 (-) Transcript_2542:2049-2636(-)
MNSTRYIRTGQITLRSGVKLQDVSFKRLLIIMCTSALLFTSNPSNYGIFWSSSAAKFKAGSTNKGKNLLTSFKSEWLGIEINVSSTGHKNTREKTVHTSRRADTNFVFFTLFKESDGVDIGYLFRNDKLCIYDGSVSFSCRWIGKDHQVMIHLHCKLRYIFHIYLISATFKFILKRMSFSQSFFVTIIGAAGLCS